MNKTIEHVIVMQYFEIKVGETVFNTEMPMVQTTEFKECVDVHYHDGYVVYAEKIATFNGPGDAPIYMYKISDMDTGCWSFFIVNHVPYYVGPSQYVDRINYTEYMKADNDMDAFIEFGNEMKQYNC
jgi:hypothetical protein